MRAQTKRFEGGQFKAKQGEYSRLCSRYEDTFYQFAFWEVPLHIHELHQVFPMCGTIDEAKPREYNV